MKKKDPKEFCQKLADHILLQWTNLQADLKLLAKLKKKRSKKSSNKNDDDLASQKKIVEKGSESLQKKFEALFEKLEEIDKTDPEFAEQFELEPQFETASQFVEECEINEK